MVCVMQLLLLLPQLNSGCFPPTRALGPAQSVSQTVPTTVAALRPWCCTSVFFTVL
jgi:hypothetical protein